MDLFFCGLILPIKRSFLYLPGKETQIELSFIELQPGFSSGFLKTRFGMMEFSHYIFQITMHTCHHSPNFYSFIEGISKKGDMVPLPMQYTILL